MNALVTAYCLCAACCGETGRNTASGRPPVVGVTIAAPRSVPFGTWVRIEVPGRPPLLRRVDDRTARRYDGRWDLLVDSHLSAKRWGARRAVLYLYPPSAP